MTMVQENSRTIVFIYEFLSKFVGYRIFHLMRKLSPSGHSYSARIKQLRIYLQRNTNNRKRVRNRTRHHLYEKYLSPDHFVKLAECYNLIEWETMQGTKSFNNWE